MSLRALIFDVDGTLAETEELHRRAFNETFAAAGLGWMWDRALYGQLLDVTGGKERIRHFIGRMSVEPSLDDAAIAALHRNKTARYTALVASGGLQLRPGVSRLIEQAKVAKMRLAVATTTSLPNVEALLRATIGYNPFDVIAAGDEVPAKKPAPDIYRLALQKLGLQAADCAAIEDTPNGLNSALGAGIACIVTKSFYGGDGPFPGAAAVVGDLSEVDLACIERWYAG